MKKIILIALYLFGLTVYSQNPTPFDNSIRVKNLATQSGTPDIAVFDNNKVLKRIAWSSLPSGSSSVLEYSNFAAFPGTGTVAKIYVDKATNIIYRWSGSGYVILSPFTTPTLQEVLDNNRDLVDGNNFQGTNAGDDNSGTNVNAFGSSAASQNIGYNVNAFGFYAGYELAIANVFKNVNLFGFFASADADNQNVFSKWVTGTTKYLGRLSFNNITADRKWELPNASGTIALTSDITSATSLQAVTTNGKTTTIGVTLLVPTSGAPEDSYLNVKLNSGSFIRGVELGHRQTVGDRTGFLKLLNVETFEQLVYDNEKINFQSDTKNINYLFDKTKANGSYTLATTSDIPAGVTIDATPTDGSANVPSSNGVFDALATKQATLTGTNFGAFANSLDAKTTPIDADLINIVDTADSNKQRKVTFTNVKAFLKTYFDTLYQTILVSGTTIKTVNSNSLLGSGNIAVEPTITAGTTSQYYRGDKTFQTLDKSAVGLANVDNTSDANKPVSSATQTALDLKADQSTTPKTIIRIITPSSALTGTTSETQITSFNFTIPANTYSANDFLKVETIAWEKAGVANASSCRLKLSNTNNYAGASNVLILSASGGNINMRGTRTYKIAGGNLKGLMSASANGIFNDNTLTNVAVSTLALDVTQPIYGFVSLSLTSGSDSVIMNELIISKW